MADDPIRGKTIRWTYSDGPVAGQTFEHTFGADGTVKYGAPDKAPMGQARYIAERITDRVHAVSYLSTASGYTLTTVIDLDARTIVSFASNEKELVVQHGRIA